tara:strand:- start:2046 stop:2600 length:555 start_codon:yes stop_codon:yes gene_type:complete
MQAPAGDWTFCVNDGLSIIVIDVSVTIQVRDRASESERKQVFRRDTTETWSPLKFSILLFTNLCTRTAMATGKTPAHATRACVSFLTATIETFVDFTIAVIVQAITLGAFFGGLDKPKTVGCVATSCFVADLHSRRTLSLLLTAAWFGLSRCAHLGKTPPLKAHFTGAAVLLCRAGSYFRAWNT